VHELCHFITAITRVLSDYRERKEWLRKNGAGLDV
jgi:predicted metal-dependent hydrolase